MAQNPRKRDKKRRQKAKKSQREAAYAMEKARLAKQSKSLRVIVDPTGGDPVLVKRVQAAAQQISFDESGGCPQDIAATVRLFHELGPDAFVRKIRSEASLRHDYQQEIYNEEQMRLWAAATYVGQRILSQLPSGYQDKLLPNYFFYPLLSPEGMTVHFDFLAKTKRDTGWGHYSRNEPKVTINGAEWIVCFSEHAIERIVERSNFEEQLTYAHYFDCAFYLRSCVYFEPVKLDENTPGLRLFMVEDLGGPPQRYRDYLRKVAGITDVLQYPVVPAYVLGYSHLDCKGKFAKATSMWYPGYRGTPEDKLVRSSKISGEDRRRLLAMADDNKTVRVVNEGRHEAIRWYHENGVPQVIFPERRLFRCDVP